MQWMYSKVTSNLILSNSCIKMQKLRNTSCIPRDFLQLRNSFSSDAVLEQHRVKEAQGQFQNSRNSVYPVSRRHGRTSFNVQNLDQVSPMFGIKIRLSTLWVPKLVFNLKILCMPLYSSLPNSTPWAIIRQGFLIPLLWSHCQLQGNGNMPNSFRQIIVSRLRNWTF